MRCSPPIVGLLAVAACGGSATEPAEVRPSQVIRMTADPISVGRRPLLVACRDGDGPWRRLELVRGGYECAVTSQRYTVLTACASESLSMVVLRHRAIEDGAPSLGFCAGQVPTAEIRGVAGGGPGLVVSDLEPVAVDSTGAFALEATPGVRDVILARGGRLAIIRDLLVEDGRVVTIDDVLAAATPIAGVRAPVTVEGAAPDETITVFSSLTTANGTRISLLSDDAPPLEAATLQADRLLASDRWSVAARADASDGGVRSARAAATTLTLPPPLAMPTVTATGTLRAPLALRWQARAGVDEWSISMSQTRRGTRTQWTAEITPRWLGDAAEHTYQFPVVAFAGWSADAETVAGAELTWRLVARAGTETDSKTAARQGVLVP